MSAVRTRPAALRLPALLLALLLAFLLALAPGPPEASAQDAPPGHGLSIFGDLKYPPDFAHFDYVNPDAPKGGVLSLVGATAAYNASFLSFDTLNGYILKGDAAQGLSLIFDTLMVRALDEPDAVYGLLARKARILEDGHGVVFTLRGGVRFHDNTPLTAADVVFSLNLLKDKGHPLISQNLREVAAVEAGRAADGGETVTVLFTGGQTRDLPLFVAQLPVFSRAYYTAHEFDESTLEPPLGSGPYRIGRFSAGRFIAYERVPGYWAQDLPVNAGRWNFDRIRFEYYRDRTTQFEAFKAGAYLFREEFTSRTWARQYAFPAVEDGRVVRLVLPDERPSGGQGWFINTRRAKFSDPRVRKALDYAFDFEWTNRNQFHGLYTRTQSVFENSPMKAQRPPGAAELALLEPLRDQLPPEVFAAPYVPPVSGGSGQDRRLLRTTARLLDEAGWTVRDGMRKNAAGETLSVEFLTDTPTFERIISPYVRNLRFLGIDARIRLVDSAQYQERLKNFDFDLTTRRYAVGNTPGVELRGYWASSFASVPGSRNLSGIADPAIDALITRVINAPDRAAQITAAKALDRTLRAGHYWVPQWFKPSHTLAFWNRFARPEIKPRYGRGVLDTWWSMRAGAGVGMPDSASGVGP